MCPGWAGFGVPVLDEWSKGRPGEGKLRGVGGAGGGGQQQNCYPKVGDTRVHVFAEEETPATKK